MLNAARGPAEDIEETADVTKTGGINTPVPRRQVSRHCFMFAVDAQILHGAVLCSTCDWLL